MAREVPFYGLQRECATLKTDLIRGFETILDHGQVLQSPEITNFEDQIALKTGRKFAVANGSCTDSLYFALVALGVGIDDEVVVPAFSFIASASCVLRIGAKPVFVDVNDSGNMSSERLERVITSKTKAIIYVHMYGCVEEKNLSKIIKIGTRLGIPVIEDAAQALGSKGDLSGTSAGAFGEISCISFDPTKVISALGSGGVFLTDNAAYASQAMKLRYHGKNAEGGFESLGFNAQMSAINAMSLIIKLRNNEAWLDKRRKIAKTYINKLGDLPLVLPIVDNIETHNYHKFVILLEHRDGLMATLKKNGVQAMIHYKEPIPAHRAFLNAKDQLKRCEIARDLSERCLSIPCHAFLSDLEIQHVVDCIRNFFRAS